MASSSRGSGKTDEVKPSPRRIICVGAGHFSHKANKLIIPLPIRDQLGANSCWAMSVSELVGIQYALENNEMYKPLSAQHLLDHVPLEDNGGDDSPKSEDYVTAPNEFDAAATSLDFTNYVAKVGVCEEAYYPLRDPENREDIMTRDEVSKLTRYRVREHPGFRNDGKNREVIMTLLRESPMLGCLKVSAEFLRYKRGVYEGKGTLQHTVLVTGYAAREKVSPSGKIERVWCWEVKNSLGSQWGYDGYGYIAMYSESMEHLVAFRGIEKI